MGIHKWIKDRQKEFRHGLEVTEQIRADKLRNKYNKTKYYEPGTIRYGLVNQQNPIDFMKDAYRHRKDIYEQKTKKKP